MKHKQRRQTEKWGTFGKKGDQPLTYIKIMDLSDSHLLHIIAHIKAYPLNYSVDTLQLMENEQKYRHKHNIFVVEEDELDKIFKPRDRSKITLEEVTQLKHLAIRNQLYETASYLRDLEKKLESTVKLLNDDNVEFDYEAVKSYIECLAKKRS